MSLIRHISQYKYWHKLSSWEAKKAGSFLTTFFSWKSGFPKLGFVNIGDIISSGFFKCSVVPGANASPGRPTFSE